jgi:Pyruvate/2-oxoacid:ferredoxin oxidoreductase delta subunit
MTDLIVDANSLYARAWYAAQEKPDQAIIASLNVAMMLFNTERIGERIDRSLFCWDGGQKKDKERAERPKHTPDNCLWLKNGTCGLCWIYCPEAAIKVNNDGSYDIDLAYCKGCGICASILSPP